MSVPLSLLSYPLLTLPSYFISIMSIYIPIFISCPLRLQMGPKPFYFPQSLDSNSPLKKLSSLGPCEYSLSILRCQCPRESALG